jgi:glutamine synthetase
MDVETLEKAFKDRSVKRVKVGGFDVDGILRGKYVSLEKFWSAVKGGFGFCDVIFGWDVSDVLYDNAEVTGWHTGYPDAHATIDLASFRIVPWESCEGDATACFLVDFVNDDGTPHPACPRGLLKQVVARCRAAGFEPYFSAEFEFFVFRETPQSARDKGYAGMIPLSPGMFGYSWVRVGQNAEVCHAILREMEAFGIPIEGLHTETGPGVYEAALRYDGALAMGDKGALFKTGMKLLASRFGLMPTFMAKWNADLPGSSGHLHQSLWKDGKNAFYDASHPHKLSTLAEHYLAGILHHMPAMTALYTPTVNGYKRYVPGVWAPLNATWGVENRTCAVRVIPGDAKSTRLEHRQTAADINPYIAIATCLACGLDGIEKKMQLPPEATGDASGAAAFAPLPRSLREATRMLAEYAPARALLGEPFIEHYVRTRDWEARQYERAVTDWELRRYFEIL